MARVLVLTNMYPPHSYGGYELSCRDVVDRWQARGHEVTVLTTDLRVPGVADIDEPDVRRDLAFYWDDHVLLSPPLRARLRRERRNQAALRAALDAARPDVVSVWNMGAMSLGLLTTLHQRNLPVVYNVCDDWLYYAPHTDAWTRLFRRSGPAAGIARRVFGVPVSVPDLGALGTFCFVTDRTRQFAEKRSRWTFPRSTVVYSGIDERDFPVTDDDRVQPWTSRLLFVGRIDERKGIVSAVDALTHLPDATQLAIIGQGDDAHLAELRQRANELGVTDRVTFGVVPRAELRARYREADVFVFPSTWEEPFGLVPIEAMACGTPVVATGRGGSAEFLADGVNCLLYEAGDAVALAAAIERLATDDDLRRRIVEGGRVTARQLTVDQLADTLEQWHLAAAGAFASGQPAHRPAPVS